MRPRPHLSSKSLIFTNTSIYTFETLIHNQNLAPNPLADSLLCRVAYTPWVAWCSEVSDPPKKSLLFDAQGFFIYHDHKVFLVINKWNKISFFFHEHCSSSYEMLYTKFMDLELTAFTSPSLSVLAVAFFLGHHMWKLLTKHLLFLALLLIGCFWHFILLFWTHLPRLYMYNMILISQKRFAKWSLHIGRVI